MRFRVSKFLMFLLIMLLFIVQPLFVSAAPRVETIDTAHICLQATKKMERQYHIKKHLLTTISSIESGRWNEKAQQTLAWPWTINAQGKGYFFNTKAEAVQKVRQLQAAGVTSIDVGCMQINLLYHGKEFASLEEAFDPMHNVEYGAKFLTNLYENNNRDWLKAAMSYHSSVPEKARIYRRKIVERFEKVKTAHNDNYLELRDNKRHRLEPIKLKRPTLRLTAPKNIITAKSQRIKAISSKQRQDVAAWREAKLEEYRMQKLLARKY